MIFVHHSGKMGDLLYALPVMRSIARTYRDRIHLTTSGLCWQLVPLLWEQPYIGDIALDDARPYEIARVPDGRNISSHWDHYQPAQGYNLSIQPKHYDPQCPVNWTRAYAWIAGVELRQEDLIALPSLVNHRRWFTTVDCRLDGKKQELAKTVVVAPEVETLEAASSDIWTRIIDALLEDYTVVLVGTKSEPNYYHKVLAWASGKHAGKLRDLRGLTTVPVLARIIAEASGFVGAHSMPWHLARLAGTPAVCLQHWREGLRRCIPIDTDPNLCPWVEPDEWQGAIEWINAQVKEEICPQE
jgi:ADP-heptose:LPS heptosyltransferase